MFSFRSFSHLRRIVSTIGRTPVISQSPSFANESIVVKCPSIAIHMHFLELRRNFAKGGGKQKEKMHDTGVKLSSTQSTDVDAYKNKLEKILKTLQEEFIKSVSFGSTTGSIETIKIKYKGKEHQLKDIAQIIRKNPKKIAINMASFPQMIPVALKAITRSGTNMYPSQDGTFIYVPVPKMSRTHCEELAIKAKSMFIKCRDEIKDAENEVLRKVKQNKEISEDDNELTKISAGYVKRAEKMLEKKQKELLGC